MEYKFDNLTFFNKIPQKEFKKWALSYSAIINIVNEQSTVFIDFHCNFQI